VDKNILIYIQHELSFTGLDYFFAWISQKIYFSIPLLFICLLILWFQHGKNGLKCWSLAVVVIVCSDRIGDYIKHMTSFARPCAEFPELIHVPSTIFHVTCSQNLNGMPSNHAFNFVTFAIFLSILLRSGKWAGALLAIALLVSFSRIYLGVHYPSQVLAGIGLGTVFGSVMALAAQRFIPFVAQMQNTARNKLATSG